MTQEVDKHYEKIVSQAYHLGLHGGGTEQEFDDMVTRPLAVGRNLVAILTAPRSYKTEAHYRLRETAARGASSGYFALRRGQRDLASIRHFEEGFGLGFDEGERVYSTPATVQAAALSEAEMTAEQTNLMVAARLLMGMGYLDYGRTVRNFARKLSNSAIDKGATA